MIDYWLGGHLHYEVDRLLADQVAGLYPEIVREFREGRAGLRRALTYLVVEQGIDCILDFGAGLPTCGNTHELVLSLNPKAKVIYSDIDPVTVTHGRELLGDLPNVLYLQCDAAFPEVVLEAPEVQQLLGGQRRVGVVFMALAHLMTDETLSRASRTLYDWAAPGSHLYLAWAGGEEWDTHPRLQALKRPYTRFGGTAYFRTDREMLRLIAPWQVTDHGIFRDGCWGVPAPDRGEDEPHVGYCLLARKPD